MPELPEVESARKLFEAHCINKKITAVHAVEDDKIFDNKSPSELSSILLNTTPFAARRLGKHLWIDFGTSQPALLLHFGMSGGTVVRNKGAAHYKRYTINADAEWPPKFHKLVLTFDDGTEWAYCDARRFGRIRTVTAPPLSVPPLSTLGWDPLLTWPPLPQFASKLISHCKGKAIKAALLDQTLAAGVGNWVADEVLYQSRIHPEQPCNSLSEEEIAAVHRWVQEVCQVACDVDAESDRFPDHWLFHVRWEKGKKEGAKIGGHAIEHVTVGGRTSAYVPAVQKLRKGGGRGSGAATKRKGQDEVSASKAEVEEEKKPKKRQPAETTAKQQRKGVKEEEALPVVPTAQATKKGPDVVVEGERKGNAPHVPPHRPPRSRHPPPPPHASRRGNGRGRGRGGGRTMNTTNSSALKRL